MPVAVLAAWFTIDEAYVLLNELSGHWYMREENFFASACLNLLCEFGWCHKGDLKTMLHEVRQVTKQL